MNSAGRWIESIVSGRLWWLAVLALLTGMSLWGASRVGVDNAVDIWFPADDPALAEYQGFLETFGNDEVVVIGLHRPSGILDEGGLAAVEAVGRAAGAVDGIANVRSVITEPVVRGGAGTLQVAPVMDPSEIRKLQGMDPSVDALVSADGTTALVLAEMAVTDDIDSRRDAVLAELQSSVRTVEPAASFGGIGVVYAALNQASTRDAAGVIGASYLLIVLLLRFLMGRWRPVMLIVAVVGLGAVWLMGLYGMSDRDINMVTMVMPTLVLVIGVSDCVHMLVHVAAQPDDLPALDRVRNGVGAVVWPCLFNTLTTAMGFLALSTASMPVVQDLGIFCAVALVAAFAGSVLLCSIFAMVSSNLPLLNEGGRVQGLVDGMARVSVTKPVPVLLAAAFVGLISAWGVTRIEVDTYSIDFLYADHPARVDSDRLEHEFGPYTPMEFVVRHPDGVRDPAILGAIAQWQDAMESDPDVGWSRSMADAIQNLDRILTGRSAGAVPSDSASLEQLLFLFEADGDADSARWMNATETETRVTVGVPMSSAREFETLMNRLLAKASFPDGVELQPSGYIPLYVQIMNHIVSSQLSSFAMAFTVIFALIGLLFRSIRMAVLAVPANLLPVLVTLGFMGLVGIRLDVATVTIAAIVLGLVVDDTTQFLYRYREVKKGGGDMVSVVGETVRTVGRPMLMTSVVLAGGFSVLGIAAIKSVAYFGILLAIALISALLADLMVVPALLVVSARSASRGS